MAIVEYLKIIDTSDGTRLILESPLQDGYAAFICTEEPDGSNSSRGSYLTRKQAKKLRKALKRALAS